jgi:outer membrane protein assembly factor BamB
MGKPGTGRELALLARAARRRHQRREGPANSLVAHRKCPLEGQTTRPGNSSPIIWGKRVFLTQSLDKKGTERAVLCLDRVNGKLLWQKSIPFRGREPTHDTNPYCSASPVTDGERVIASHVSAGVVCYDFDGKQLWHRDLGSFLHIWGNAASPILYGNLVILNCGPGERTFLLAMDKKTGKDVWKVEEPGGKSGEKGDKEWIGSWSTPRIIQVQGQDQLIMSWPNAVKAYHPKTGKVIWTCGGLTKLVYTSPLATPEVVVAMAGFYGTALAVKTGGKGDVTNTHRLWHHTKQNPQRIGSGVIVGGYLFMHRKNALFYKTQNGARVGDLFMSLIYTCQLNQANPFDYLTQLQQHADQVAAGPQRWMPWNYRTALT